MDEAELLTGGDPADPHPPTEFLAGGDPDPHPPPLSQWKTLADGSMVLPDGNPDAEEPPPED
jgi:hypothetical protein